MKLGSAGEIKDHGDAKRCLDGKGIQSLSRSDVDQRFVESPQPREQPTQITVGTVKGRIKFERAPIRLLGGRPIPIVMREGRPSRPSAWC
jgi:hypothetical protein